MSKKTAWHLFASHILWPEYTITCSLINKYLFNFPLVAAISEQGVSNVLKFMGLLIWILAYVVGFFVHWAVFCVLLFDYFWGFFLDVVLLPQET